MTVDVDTFFGGSVGFTTLTVISLDILSSGLSGVSAPVIDTAHALTTGDVRTKMPGDLLEPGQYRLDVLYDSDDDIWSLAGVSDTITITFPIPGGKTGAATIVFTGFIADVSNEQPIDDKMTATILLQISTDPVVTAAT